MPALGPSGTDGGADDSTDVPPTGPDCADPQPVPDFDVSHDRHEAEAGEEGSPRGMSAVGSAPRQPARGGAPTYHAVHRHGVSGLIWEDSRPRRKLARALQPDVRTLEILAALWEHRLFLTSQIAEEWWPGNDPSAAQRHLGRLAGAGWVRRFRLRVPKGKHEWVYRLAPAGFAVAQQHHGPEGPYIPERERFSERRLADYGGVQHDLQVNAWVLVFRRIVGDLVVDWKGPDHGAVHLPTKLVEGQRRPIDLADVRLEGHLQISDLRRKTFAKVVPDATVSMEMPSGRRFDLLFELDRTRRANKNADKFLRYDALITAWWRNAARYQALGEPPAAVFICPTEAGVFGFMEEADRQLMGSVLRPGDAPARWSYPGRERTLFVSERDVHEGSLRAWMLQRQPRELTKRRELAPRDVALPSRPK